MASGDRHYLHINNAFSNQSVFVGPFTLKLISFNHLNQLNSQFIMIFDLAAPPIDGTFPDVEIQVAPNGQAMYAPSMEGRGFVNGIVVALSTTPVSLTAQTVPELTCQFEGLIP